MTVLHRPYSATTFPRKAEARCPQLLSYYRHHFPEAEEGGVDFEDWSENVVMMQALERAASHASVPFRLKSSTSNTRMLGRGTLTPARAGGPDAVMWGLFLSSDAIQFDEQVSLLWNHAEAARCVSRWALSRTFGELAGRHVEILDMDFDALRAALARLAAAGQAKAFLKTLEKGWAAIIDTTGEIPSDIAWDIVANEGAKQGLILQGLIAPRCEYRMFIVGDQLVTGAGCIEAFTPLDAVPGLAFDARVEITRNKTRPYEDTELVSRYAAFAQTFAESWAAEFGAGQAYTLDLCLDANTREIVPVELNPLHNTGLYACNPDLLAEALVAPLARARA